MKTVTNQLEAIELTNDFINSLTKNKARQYFSYNTPIISITQASIELGVFGWYYNDKQMCCDIINVAILNKLSERTKHTYTKGELMWLINNKKYHSAGLYKFLKMCHPDRSLKESVKHLAGVLGCHYMGDDWRLNDRTW